MKNIPEFDDFYVLNEDAKDETRISDIIKKSNGHKDKEIQLASVMAKAITNKDKAIRRYEACVKLLDKNDPVTIIFGERANELGARITLPTASPTISASREYVYDDEEAAKIYNYWLETVVSKLRGFNWGDTFTSKMQKSFSPSDIVSIVIYYNQKYGKYGLSVNDPAYRMYPKLNSAIDSLLRIITYRNYLKRLDMGDAKQNVNNPAHFLFIDELSKDKEAADMQILKDACKEAYAAYKAPQYLFEPNEELITYPSQRSGRSVIKFNDPWAMWFWNHNMIGQMSDGYWENSRKYKDDWRGWAMLKPVFDPNYKYSKTDNFSDIQNPKLVQQYAIRSDGEYKAIGKIAVMKNEELLVFVQYGSDDKLDYTQVKTLENAEKIAQEKGISLEVYLAFIWEPGLNKSQVNKLVSEAHTNMRDAMVSVGR
jgi:hypothetical protein